MKIAFKGILKKKIFTGDAGYLIAAVEDIDINEERIIVGYLKLFQEQVYEFEGEVVEHDRYGEQVQISSYKIQIPKNGEDVINFLSSSSFNKVGKRTAKKIYDYFLEETIDILKHKPEEVINIGIKKELVDEISSKLNDLDGMDELYKILDPLGFSDYYIKEIYKYIEYNSIKYPQEFVKQNPYQLVKEIDGITFEKADKIFLTYNNDEKDPYRIKSAILDEINNFCFRSGDTYINKAELAERVNLKLNFEVENFNEYVQILEEEQEIFRNDNLIALKNFYDTEKAIAQNVLNRLAFLNLGLEENQILSFLEQIENSQEINYSPLQKKAIINSLENNLSIITGGPGTGKTTIIKAVAQIFQQIKYQDEIIKRIEDKIILCAPTGRAAQRMKEATGYEARTIHSLLEWDPYKNEFNRNIANPLTQELVIIDEFSMVDIFLAKAIFQAIRPEAIIVLVGDSAQLESVNPGNVLHDLIACNKISTIHLDVIFRQGEGSSIAELAKNIDEGQKIELINTKDMSVISRNSRLPLIVKEIFDRSLKAGYDEMDVQILYPKYSGINGIDKINEILLSNTDEKYTEFGEKKFYLNDKVMQLKNNYDKDIYNGDIGKVTKIYAQNPKPNDLSMEVTFKEKRVNLVKKDLIDIAHAYAISIHKSQGSEFKVIILPVSNEAKRMLNKKLLYTAITRAKEKLIIIGDLECFNQSLVEEGQHRNTNLENFLSIK